MSTMTYFQDSSFYNNKVFFQMGAVSVACHHLGRVIACSSPPAVLMRNEESHTKWVQVLEGRNYSQNLRCQMKVGIETEK
jgi:hypothetical protein